MVRASSGRLFWPQRVERLEWDKEEWRGRPIRNASQNSKAERVRAQRSKLAKC